MEYLSIGDIETRNIAKIIIEDIIKASSKGPLFVGLIGDLGAGKTTFMKGVAEFFDIARPIQSPTFVIQKIYEISEENREAKGHDFKRLVHMDLYRLEDEQGLQAIRWDDYKRDSGNILFAEWPNQIWQKAPSDMIGIQISHEGGDKRKIFYEKE